MGDRTKSTVLGWIELLMGVIGSLGGIAVSSWFLIAASHRGGGDPVVDFSEAELTVYSIAMLVFFFVALLASLLGLRTPRASGLALVAAGGPPLSRSRSCWRRPNIAPRLSVGRIQARRRSAVPH